MLALLLLVGAAVAMEDGPVQMNFKVPTMVMKLNLNDLPDPSQGNDDMFEPIVIKSAFQSSNLLDDFGHKSVFEDIFPESHHVSEIFPSSPFGEGSPSIINGPPGGFLGGIMDMMSQVMGGAMRRHRPHQPHPQRMRLINLAAPPTEMENEEQKEKKCCCDDIHAHCSHVHHDGTVAGVFRLTRCLAKRGRDYGDLEPVCAEKLTHTVAGACYEDIDKLCGGVVVGHSGIHSCLYSHQLAKPGVLTPSCAAYIKSTKVYINPKKAAKAAAVKAQAAPAAVQAAAKRADTKKIEDVKHVARESLFRAPTSLAEAKAKAVAAKKVPATAASAQQVAAGKAGPAASAPVWVVVGLVGAGTIAVVLVVALVRWGRSGSAAQGVEMRRAMLI